MEPSSSTPSPPAIADSTFTSVKQEPTSNPASPLEANSPGSITLRNRVSYEKADDFLSELLRDNKNEQRFSTETVRSISIKPLSNLDENESSSSNDEAIHTKSLTSNHKGSTFSQSVRPVSSMSVIASTNTPPSPASTSSIDRHDSITSAENTVILTCLAKISTEINQHTAILNELLRNSRNNGTAIIVKPPEAPDFPITAVDDFKRFDKNLRTNINLREYMVSRLSSLGGSGCDGLCRRILKFLITDNVAVCYNWKGKNAKMPFEKTCSMEVIYESVKLHFPQTEKSDFVTAETTKNWLKYAKSRQVKKLQEKCEKNVEESS